MPHIRRFAVTVTLLMGWLAADPVAAHFMFLRIVTEPGTDRRAEVFFGEQATAGDPQFIDKIAHTRLWSQSKPGKFAALELVKRPDRLRAALPGTDPVAVVGYCEYGIVRREVAFLLRYYPKAVAGDPAAVNRWKPRPDAQFEIVPTVTGDEISFVAMHRGKPLADAVFNTVDDDLEGVELRADDQGRAVWKPKAPGHYCVYTGITLAEPGMRDDKPYAEIREFATLSFEWPLVVTNRP
jgi:hypothetical protein